MPENGDSDGDSFVTRRKMIGTGVAGIGAMVAGCSGDGGSGGDGGDGGDGGSGGDGGDGGDSGTPTVTDNPMEALHGWTGGDGAAAAEEIVSMWEERHPDW